MLTAAQIEERRGFIGASDIAKMMGLSKFGTMRDVYEEKIGNVPAYDAGIKARMGNFFEHTILDFAVAEGLVPSIQKDMRIEYKNDDKRTIARLAANMDAITESTKIPVECKMSGAASMWGDDGTDAVPMYVLPQVQMQMLCCGASEGIVVAFLSTAYGFDMRTYWCQLSEDFIEQMLECCDYLWSCIQSETPPDGTMTLATAKHLTRIEGSQIRIDSSLVSNFLHAKEVAKAAGDGVEVCKERIFAAMGNHEIALAGDFGSLHYKKQNRKGYRVEPATMRVLRHHKAATL